MKLFLLISLSFFQALYLKSQVEIPFDTLYMFAGKNYKACVWDYKKPLSCHDSTEAIIIISLGLKDFPKEILKYKNLKLISFDCYSWEVSKNYFTKREKKFYERFYNTWHEEPWNGGFRVNRIKRVPDEIINLGKLEGLGLGKARTNSDEYFRVTGYLDYVKVR